MDCPSCQTNNPGEANFCLKCGAALARACPDCGKELPAEAAFCMACGRDLSQPAAPSESSTPAKAPEPSAPSGERRQATVLFSDLSGYTAMNEKLDPEEVEAIMSRIKAEAVKIVESHGGIVSQFVGDEVLALFGIPTAHEDDPRRAVRAALELHELARRIGLEVEEKIGRPLRMHTGINSGLIVTSTRDQRDGTIGVTGDTVNTGARLKAFAGDDNILVSRDTQRRIAPFFELEELPPAEMKGKDETMTPYRVLGESDVETRFDAAEQRGFTPFIGRERELDTLNSCLAKAVSGKGQLVTVVGEAGVGKSRLLYEFRRSLQREQINMLEGRCQSYGENTPYLPLIDALRRGLRLQPEDSPEGLLEAVVANVKAIDPALERYIPAYLHLLSITSGEYALPETLAGEELRRNLQEAYAAMTTLSASNKPLVFFLEDWHWADEASNAALIYLFGLIAPYPIMLVVNYRPEFAGNWGSNANHTPIAVAPLDAANGERIVRAVLEVDGLPVGFNELIHERTGGNPFFIEEMCSNLKEEGAIQVRDGKAALTVSSEELKLPGTVQAVIRSRLDRLDNDHREVLRLASVIGREFGQRLLERAYPEEGSLTLFLEALKAQGVIQQVRVLPEVAYTFKHVLTQVVVYETLLLQQRKTLHRLVGQAMETLYADRLEEHYETLAHHAYQGGDWEKALVFSRQAGEKAAARSAHQEAIGNFTKGLEVIQHLPEGPEMTQQEITLQLALGVQLMTTKGYGSSEAGRPFTRAMELCRQLKETPQIFPALWGLARNLLIQSRIQESYEVGEQLLTIAQKLEDPERLLQAHFMQAGTNFWLGNMNLARCHSEQGLTFYRPEDHRKLMDRIGHNIGEACLSYFGQALWLLGYPDQGLEKIDQAIASAEAFSHPFSIARALYFSARFHNYRREREMVRMRTQALLSLADEYGFGLWRACGKFMYGWTLAAEGSVDEGIGLIHEGISLTEETGNPGRCYALALLAEAYEQAGQIEKGLDALNEAARVIQATGERNWEAEVCRLKGELLLLHGEAESEADACFRQALEIARRQEAKSLELRAAVSWGRLRRRQGREKEGRALLKGIYDWFTEGLDTVDLQEAKALIDELA